MLWTSINFTKWKLLPLFARLNLHVNNDRVIICNVGFHFLALVAGVLALTAVIQINSSVPSCMSDKIAFPTESDVAVLANELLHIRVHFLMLTKCALALEALAAGLAAEGLDVWVRWHVFLQFEHWQEWHVADLALKLRAVNLGNIMN